jgi:hypothetical protein
MIGDFGCCTDPYDESQGLVEIIEDELSSYRGTLKHPLWMLRQESGDLICVEIRDHASIILPDPCVDPEDDHPQSCGAAPTKCPRTDSLRTARSPLSLRSTAAPAHIGTKGYPLRYSGGASSVLGDRQCAGFPAARRFRVECGALAQIRSGHCADVDTPFAGYALGVCLVQSWGRRDHDFASSASLIAQSLSADSSLQAWASTAW